MAFMSCTSLSIKLTFLDQLAFSFVQDLELLKADFYLQIGLQSMRGGNFTAAASRLQSCREHLLSLPEDRRSAADVCVQLGAVCGSLVSFYLASKSKKLKHPIFTIKMDLFPVHTAFTDSCIPH